MAKFVSKPTIHFECHLVLTEDETRALDALVGYGADPFIEAFYEKMGRAYLEPYEKGLRSLFETVRSEVGFQLGKINDARETFDLPAKD